MEALKNQFDEIAMRCITIIENIENVEKIIFESNPGLVSVDYFLWERKNSLKIPSDLRAFYSIFNGFHFTWKLHLVSIQIEPGYMNINKLENLQPFPIQGAYCYVKSTEESILIPSSLSNKAFTLDSLSQVGEIVLLFKGPDSYPQVWLVDQSRRWHFICHSFSDYIRLMIVHLGIYGWQLIFTPEGLSETTKQWMGAYTKERLCVDLHTHNEIFNHCIAYEIIPIS